MKVLKFGGTSVGSVERIKALPGIIKHEEEQVVVFSAMSGITNQLTEICNLLKNGQVHLANNIIDHLIQKHDKIVQDLVRDLNLRQQAVDYMTKEFLELKQISSFALNSRLEKIILSKGELLSSYLIHVYFEEQGIEHKLIPALNFMRIDKDSMPDNYYIRQNLQRELEQAGNPKLVLTQGFICRNVFGEVDNLQRGGSDYTASIIGAALDAEEIQIWTDISGVHNNDPRFVKGTKAIDILSFEEAAELAYFGAKIIHPSTLIPAQEKNIPVRLKNTFAPEDAGTLISAQHTAKGIKSVAAKDHITVIKIRSARMLLAYGFLRKIFEVFEKYKTPVDVITTSEVAVSLTIDETEALEKIVDELSEFGTVEVDRDQSVICIVGNIMADSKGYANKVFSALKNIPIRMISYGGSNYNITVVVNSSDKVACLNALHNKLKL